MAKFRIVYSDGVEEVIEQSDCHTVEQLTNCRFGSADTSKVTVGLAEEPSVEHKEAHKPKKPKAE